MASRKIDDLDSVLAYALALAIGQWKVLYPNDPQPYISCTYRPPAEQTALYNQPFDRKDNDGDGKVDEADERVTNAKAGQSPHNYLPSLAADIAFKKPAGGVDWNVALFDRFAKLVLQTSGVTWGGTFKSLPDRPHFERSGWQALSKKTA